MSNKVQGETLPSTQRPRLLDEIEIVPVENLKCEITWPLTTVDYLQLSNTYISLYLDGFFIKQKLCDCPVKTLMESGCLCGGR